jgi:acyl carrier protein
VTTDELRDLIFDVLADIAPEADPAAVDPAEDLRDELDLDSMDELTMITQVSERLGIDIPEKDYPQMRTIESAVGYLAGRLTAHAAG